MRLACFAVAVLLLALALPATCRSLAQAKEFQQVKLPYALDSVEPYIDNRTMNLHYGTHYKTFITNLNAAVKKADKDVQDMDLTTLVKSTSSLQDKTDLFNTVRNSGGGAWNHALYFKHLAPAGSKNTDPKSSVSSELNDEFEKSFKGDVTEVKKQITAAASRVFGSGWAWLCYTGDKLIVTTTQNQDNPLAGNLPNARSVDGAGCTPILGLDLWEHSYYLKHGPARAAYIEDFFNVVDWAQVSRNYEAAKAGKTQSIVE